MKGCGDGETKVESGSFEIVKVRSDRVRLGVDLGFVGTLGTLPGGVTVAASRCTWEAAATITMDDKVRDKPQSDLWPTAYLGGDGTGASGPDEVALIILNSPIPSYDYLLRLYNHASLRICADGGANRMHDLLSQHDDGQNSSDVFSKTLPTLIHGDLDSLRQDVQTKYESVGVEVSQDPDQYSTDFGKAIKQVMARMPNVKDILVLGSIGGRVDQGLGLLGELHREQKVNHPGIRFWLFSEASVSTIIAPGTTTLHTPLRQGLIKRNAGILPIYGSSSITTTGFEWDVKDWETEMGGNVSTSNHIIADRITIETSNDVLFTVERAVDR